VAGSCVPVNEFCGSIKRGEFLDYLNDSPSRMSLFHGVSQSVSYN
jgi:hypothetical protein